HVVCALLLHQMQALLASGGTDDGQAGCASQLHRRRPDSAAGAVHQENFSWFRRPALQESAISSSVGNAHGRTLFEADTVRKRMYLAFIAQGLLGVASAERTRGVHAIPSLELLDASPNRQHY